MEESPKPKQEVGQESVVKIEKALVWETLRTKGLEAPGVRKLVEQENESELFETIEDKMAGIEMK